MSKSIQKNEHDLEINNKTSFDFESFIKNTPEKPGVYCMHSTDNKTIYVGKAVNLKKRISSYFSRQTIGAKVQALIKKISNITFIITTNETEALLLEQTLIKKYKPPYNILLRDDKSYPYICLSNHKFPRLFLYRGGKKKNVQLFGPYPSAGNAKEALKSLQKIFKVRQCTDSYFANRTRPCLQYQIKQCKAPCTAYVSSEEYNSDVNLSIQFLNGKSHDLIKQLIKKMEDYASKMQYEEAAQYRNQIQALQQIQTTQVVDTQHGDIDIIGIAVESGSCCIEVFFVRNGALLGHRHFLQNATLGETKKEILHAFLSQFYLSHANKRDFPKEIILPIFLENIEPLQEALHQVTASIIKIKMSLHRKEKQLWLDMAEKNALQNLQTHLTNKQTIFHRFVNLKEILGLHEIPTLIECFDISHTFGESTVASCVVFNQHGPNTEKYRKFNIKNCNPGDDYTALKEAVQRKYKKAPLSENNSDFARLPNILLIDGGLGQINVVKQALEEINVKIQCFGIAKGERRKVGLETIINCQTGECYPCDLKHSGFILLMQIRDEAHRFAISGHRLLRDKKRKKSFLESIDGLGPKRRATLMKHFGGLQGIKKASVTDLANIPGISLKLANEINNILNN